LVHQLVQLLFDFFGVRTHANRLLDSRDAGTDLQLILRQLPRQPLMDAFSIYSEGTLLMIDV
jgi:hypothetical protein